VEPVDGLSAGGDQILAPLGQQVQYRRLVLNPDLPQPGSVAGGNRDRDRVVGVALAAMADRQARTRAASVAQAALHCPALRAVAAEDQTTILQLLTERRGDLAGERTRILNRLHSLLRDLLPGGPTDLTAAKAAAPLRRGASGDGDRRLPPAAGPRAAWRFAAR
jgi:hypothetical protein